MSEEDDEERSLWVVSGDPIAMMDQPFDFNYSESFYLLSDGGGKIELIMICLDGESEFFSLQKSGEISALSSLVHLRNFKMQD